MMDKKCTKCKQSKPIGDFPIRKENGSPQSWCVQCYKERKKIKEDAFVHLFIGDDPVWMGAYFD